jgi:hypothetical protein
VDTSIGIRPLTPSTEELKCTPCACLMRIYIKMFQLIEPELEAALAKESADRAA